MSQTERLSFELVCLPGVPRSAGEQFASSADEYDRIVAVSDAASRGLSDVTAEVVLVLGSHAEPQSAVFERFSEALMQGEDVAYSDAWTGSSGDIRFGAWTRRPVWSPVRLLSTNYVGPVIAIRRSSLTDALWALLQAGRMYEFLLTAGERFGRMAHIPEPLYIAQAASPPSGDRGTRAASELEQLQSYLQKNRPELEATAGEVPTVHNIMWPEVTGKISIIIPTRGSSGMIFGADQTFVVEAIRSVCETSGHLNLEFVVVYDTGTPEDVLTAIRNITDKPLRLVEYSKPFNFSEKCNVGFLESTGEIVVLLNDDIRAIAPNFIGELVAPLSDPSIGLTGAYLEFEDRTIQHVGHCYAGWNPRHPLIGEPASGTGPECTLVIDREVSGLTAACVALTRHTYVRAGGLTELLPSNYNDVDFSHKVGSLGVSLVWLHRVRAFHFESKTRVGTVHEWERSLLQNRWGVSARDPFWPYTA